MAGPTVPASVTADPAPTLGALAWSVSVGTMVTPIGVDTTRGSPSPPTNWARTTSLCAISSEPLKAPSGASGRLVRVRPPVASRSWICTLDPGGTLNPAGSASLPLSTSCWGNGSVVLGAVRLR